jgi:hypothetical protein
MEILIKVTKDNVYLLTHGEWALIPEADVPQFAALCDVVDKDFPDGLMMLNYRGSTTIYQYRHDLTNKLICDSKEKNASRILTARCRRISLVPLVAELMVFEYGQREMA